MKVKTNLKVWFTCYIETIKKRNPFWRYQVGIKSI